jgi:hypothetical protein
MRWRPPEEAEWYRWFAWRPIILGTGQRVWLEWVERRLSDDPYGINFDYRDVA